MALHKHDRDPLPRYVTKRTTNDMDQIMMPKALSSCLCVAGVITSYSNHGVPSRAYISRWQRNSTLNLPLELLLSQSDIMGVEALSLC